MSEDDSRKEQEKKLSLLPLVLAEHLLETKEEVIVLYRKLNAEMELTVELGTFLKGLANDYSFRNPTLSGRIHNKLGEVYRRHTEALKDINKDI